MQVTIKYNDGHSLTVEEIVRQATENYGKNVEVEVMPDSTKAHDLIYHAVQKILTHDQLSAFYDDKTGYQKTIQNLRNELIFKLEDIVSQVIIDNESKVT